jgi:hypothetical protein
MLYRGAASLAWRGEDFEFAKRLIAEAMNGYPPEQVKNDLRQLLAKVKLSIVAKNLLRH